MSFKSLDFLPKHNSDKELFQWLTRFIDYQLERYDEEIQVLINKYKDYFTVSSDTVKEVLREFGFDYIMDLFEKSGSENLSAFRGFVNLMHSLKGGKSGIELVFKLVGTEAYTQEWWEEEPKGEPDTYRIYINGGYIDIEFMDALKRFSVDYVYPILKEIVVEMMSESEIEFRSGNISEAWATASNESKKARATVTHYQGNISEVWAYCIADELN